MEIPADVLEKLKCNRCEVYLSRGPVFKQHDGAAVCGRCFSNKRPATRSMEYETLAKLLRFPCKNKDLGCKETVGFADEEQEIVHEATCEFRQYVCPLVGSARCDWLGTKSQVLYHCRTQHADQIINNPCTLQQNIASSTLNNFLLHAFKLLFVIYTKVCVSSGKLYYCVRLLDASDLAKDFLYKLTIKRNKVEIIKMDDVAPQGCLVLQEPTAMALDINSLLSMLGGWDGVKVTLAVKPRRLKRCAECGAEVSEMLYRGWKCKRCTPAKRICKNQTHGCTYQDIPKKCMKHQIYFCLQRTKCYICDANVPRGRLFVHYMSEHFTEDNGETWRTKMIDGWQPGLLSCPAGTAIYSYKLDNSDFILGVFLAVLSERLSEFRCVVRVTQPSTCLTRTFTPDITYDKRDDWEIKINKTDFPDWSKEFDICIDISKI